MLYYSLQRFSLLGAPKGGSYAAANAYLDTLAHRLSKKGTPTISIAWGVWKGLGLADQANREERLQQHGIFPLTLEEGLSGLEYCMSQRDPNSAILSVDWDQYSSLNSAISLPLLKGLGKRDRGKASANNKETPPVKPKESLSNSPSKGNNEDQFPIWIKMHIAELMRYPHDELDTTVPLNEIGFDSIMAVQLKNELEFNFNISIPTDRFMVSSIQELEQLLTENSSS